MDKVELDEIIDFITSSEDCKKWPEHVLNSHNTKDSKRNFRRKCAAFTSVEGTLHYKHKKHGLLRVISADEKDSIIAACHSDPTSAHLGINKTSEKICSRYFWSGSMNEDIRNFIGKLCLFDHG